MFIIIIIIIIIIIRYGCLLSQAFSSWYFAWTSGDIIIIIMLVYEHLNEKYDETEV